MKTRTGLVLGLLAAVMGARTYGATGPHTTPMRPHGSHATAGDKKGTDDDKKLTLAAINSAPSTWLDHGTKKGNKTDGKLAVIAPKKPKKDDKTDGKLAVVAPKKPKKDDGKLASGTMLVKDTKKKQGDKKLTGDVLVAKKKVGFPKKADGYLVTNEIA